LVRRLWSRRAAEMLVRNTIVSGGIFAFDIGLLWLLVEQAGMGKIAAAIVAFVVANSVHYVFGRSWVFRGTERALASGYFYFLVNAGIGFIITISLFAVMIRLTSVNYLIARIMVSVIAGLTVFLLNAVLNFRRL
jgi:putative flippase GtrA